MAKVQFRGIACTVRGVKNEEMGKPCQDAAVALPIPGGMALLVSDGLSAAKQAHLGSQLAVDAGRQQLATIPKRCPRSSAELIDRVRTHFDATLQAYNQGVEQLSDAGSDPRDFRCTLAVVLLYPCWLGMARIGDAFVVTGDGHDVELLAPPERLHEDSSVTRILRTGETPDVLVLFDRALRGVALSTDGLEGFIDEEIVSDGAVDLYPVPWEARRETFGHMFSEIAAGLSDRQLSSILSAKGFREDKGDDIGIAVAAC